MIEFCQPFINNDIHLIEDKFLKFEKKLQHFF
uniref:Uncharacterized protein n=1 Tax=Tetranychus urticae TaxID=32264 RepID=T1JU94_TETUR